METLGDAALVDAARAGDRQALEALLTAALPLLYNVVGRALDGHPDVDDVVQQTVLGVIRGLPGLREPDRFRAWMISIAYRQLQDRGRGRTRTLARQQPFDEQAEAAHPVDDFAEATVDRLGRSAQRREVVEASRLMTADNQRVLALWWQEATGALNRAELADALGLNPAHAAVNVSRMKGQLDLARTVLRAWRAVPRCPQLTAVAGGRDDHADPRWLRRVGRHVRGCAACGRWGRTLIPAEQLLAGVALLPVPLSLLSRLPALLAPPPHPAAVAAATSAAGRSATVPAARHAIGPARHTYLTTKHALVGSAALLGTAAVFAYAVFYSPQHREHPDVAAPPPSAVLGPSAPTPTAVTASPPAPAPASVPPSAAPAVFTGVTAADVYVAPGGDDGGPGSLGEPFATLGRAVSVVRPGQTIAVRGGTYRPTVPVTIATSGTAGHRITLSSYRNERPVFDIAAIPADKWFVTQQANFWTVQGLEIRNGVNHPYACLSCRSDVFQRLSIHDNTDSSLILRGDNTIDNQVLDSDFFGNHDDATNGENADGLDIKFGSGTGNVVRRCRVYDNSDDGLDLTEFTSPVTVDTVWSYGNGVNRWNIAGFAGDGNGFKLGGGSPAAAVDHVVSNSAAWDNASFGFSENSNPGKLLLRNDTAYHNDGQGFAFVHSSSTLEHDLALSNQGEVWLGDAVTATGNSWNQTGWSTTALRTTDPSSAQAPRRPDGSLPPTTFLVNTRDPTVGAPMP